MGNVKDSIEIAKEVTRTLSETPEGKKAVTNLGQSASIMTETINNALLPLAAVNFGFQKARDYFRDRFPQEITEKTKYIPPENLQEPKPSIAGPALQGLAFTHDESNLKEMYLSLLATAMDNRSSSNAHPAFVEIIRQLDSEEVSLLDSILKSDSKLPAVELHKTSSDQSGYIVLLKHVLQIEDVKTGTPLIQGRLPAMVDNWIRLGLVEVSYTTWLTDDSRYGWVNDRPEFIKLSEIHNSEDHKVTFKKGFIERTPFGEQFAKSVGTI